MTIVRPAPPRHRFEEAGEALRITIPSRRHWGQIALLGLWGVYYLVIGFFLCMFATLMISGLLESSPQRQIPFFLLPCFSGVLLIYVLIGTGFVANGPAWVLRGKETIDVTSESVTISRRPALPPEKPRTFLAEALTELRATPQVDPHQTFLGQMRFLPTTNRRNAGAIAFDYGAKTYRFGFEIDEAEAKQIVAAIKERFPRYE